MNRSQKRHVYTAEMVRAKINHAIQTAKNLNIPIDLDHYIRISRNTNSMSELNNILEIIRNEIKNTILTTKINWWQAFKIRIKRMFR